MEEIAERRERKPVMHGVLDEGPFPIIAKPVAVPPESVGTKYLLVYEPERRLPIRDKRPPAQWNFEQA